MPKFYLPPSLIKQLEEKYHEFKRSRERVHELMKSYVADYRTFTDNRDDRTEYLEEKYAPRVPNFSHLIFFDDSVYWNVQDIAILLGRTQPAISITLSKMELSESWCARLLALRRTAKSANGNKIFVYQDGIFDLIIDRYEEEYIQRFTKPRRGEAPDIDEVKRFWAYLHEREKYHLGVIDDDTLDFPDVPAMTIKDILRLIWDKVFDIRIETLCAVIFAIAFEVMRRFFSLSIWFAVLPAAVLCACVILIHMKKSPDLLSDIGAGALLFLLLWVSGVLTFYSREPLKTEQMITLQPQLSGDDLSFVIHASDFQDVCEFLYSISPDNEFHSTGFLNQLNPKTGRPYPNNNIKIKLQEGNIALSVLYLEKDGNKSKIWPFSFDVAQEIFSLCKQNILNLTQGDWIQLYRLNDKTYLSLNPFLLSDWGMKCIDSLVYGLNTSQPDIIANREELIEAKQEAFYPKILKDEFDSVTSYLVFLDGTSSDIRENRIIR